MDAERTRRADLHTHTHYSPDAITSPKRFVEACRRRGLGCVAVTDHNTIRGALSVRDIAEFTVIVGEEIRTARGEVLGLFLTEEIPRGLSPDETVERIKAQGGIAGVPHPCDRFRGALDPADIVRLAPQIDFIEVLNARVVRGGDNDRAARLAAEHGFALSACSDAHSPGELGRAYVELRPFEGASDFLAALRRGRIGGRLSSPLVHLWSRYGAIRRWLGWRPA